MGLSKSINGDTEYVEYRENLYWNKYKYKGVIELVGIHMYRWYKFPINDDIKKYYTRRIDANRLDAIRQNIPILNTIIPVIKENVKKNTITIRTEGDRLSVFTNDLSFLNDLKQLHNNIKFVTASPPIKTGVKYFARKPKHKFRIYMKSTRLTGETRTEIIETISKNKNLFPSRGLKRWMNPENITPYWSRRWVSSAWYIDLDDDSYISYLHLMFNDIFGKVYTLEKRPEPIAE